MRQSTFWALAVSLLMTSVASATMSSESETASRTAEIVGTGLAVRLPADWRLWSAPAGDEAVLAADMRTRQSCTFAPAEGATSAEDAAQVTRETVEAHKQLELVAYSGLDVPVGDAVRVSYRYLFAPEEDRHILHEYYVSGPVGVASIHCSAVDPPADHWQSIVESLEPVEAEGPTSAQFDPLVEVPDHGFAIDLGAEWLVRPWGGLGPVLGGSVEDERPLPEVSMSVLRAVTAEGRPADAECMVEDATGVAGLPDADEPAEWQAVFLESAGALQQKTSVPDVTAVDLASGPAVLADWKRWWGMPATAWVFLDGEHRIVLFCRADAPPDDRWRSIAETFRFLPEE